MDCSWGEGNNACDGGEDFRAYQWIMRHGQATEGDYGAYKAQVGYSCFWFLHGRFVFVRVPSELLS